MLFGASAPKPERTPGPLELGAQIANFLLEFGQLGGQFVIFLKQGRRNLQVMRAMLANECFVPDFLGAERAPVQFTTDGDTRSLAVGKLIQGSVRPIAGARANEEVTVVNTQYWMGPEVVVAEATKGRVRAFGRVWNFEGRSAEICSIKWEGP